MGSWEEYDYDGDGNLVLHNNTWNGREDSYFVRSTVLSKNLLNGEIPWNQVGGQYLIKISERKLAIHVGGEEVAVRNYETISAGESNKVIWQHRDPYHTVAKVDGNATEQRLYSVDPLGVLVKTASQEEFDSYWNPPSGGDPSPPSGFYSDSLGQSSSYGYSSPIAGNWGLNCYIDGIQRPCEQAFRLVSNGSASIENVNTPTGSVNVPGLSIIEDFSSTSSTTGGWNPETGQFEYTTTIAGTSTYRLTTSSMFMPAISQQLNSLQQDSLELFQSRQSQIPRFKANLPRPDRKPEAPTCAPGGNSGPAIGLTGPYRGTGPRVSPGTGPRVSPGAAAGLAGLALLLLGYLWSTTENPYPIPCKEPQPVSPEAAKWSCTASCNVENFGNVPNAPSRVTGTGTGSNEDEACRNAKRAATQSAPPGTYARHCQCDCSK